MSGVVCPDCRVEHDRILDLWRNVIEEDRARDERDWVRVCAQARVSMEMVTVAVRMLQRAGKLAPTTDDERTAVRLVEFAASLPPGSRRVLPTDTPDYVEATARLFQPLLFDDGPPQAHHDAERPISHPVAPEPEAPSTGSQPSLNTLQIEANRA